MNSPIPGTAASADDPACKPIFAANDKLFTTPNHIFTVQTSPGSKPRSSEIIFVDGVRYIFVTGKWTRSTMSTQQVRAQEEENRRNAKGYSCRYLHDEVVNGEASAVYGILNQDESGKTESRVWISKSKGLFLRQEIDLDPDAGKGTDVMSVRYEYSNVRAPQI